MNTQPSSVVVVTDTQAYYYIESKLENARVALVGRASEVLGKCWHFQLHWGRLIAAGASEACRCHLRVRGEHYQTAETQQMLQHKWYNFQEGHQGVEMVHAASDFVCSTAHTWDRHGIWWAVGANNCHNLLVSVNWSCTCMRSSGMRARV